MADEGSTSSLVEEGILIRHGTLRTDELSFEDDILSFICDIKENRHVVLHDGGQVQVIRRNPSRRKHFMSQDRPLFLIERFQTLKNLKSLLAVPKYGCYAGTTADRIHVRSVACLEMMTCDASCKCVSCSYWMQHFKVHTKQSLRGRSQGKLFV